MLFIKRVLPALFGVALLTFASGAQATLFTYSYTGLPFTDVNGQQDTGNNPLNNISGLFTLDTATNVSASLTNGNASVSDFSFGDGIQTFTFADSTLTFAFNTDIDGNILNDGDLNLLVVSNADSDDFMEIGNLVNAFGSIVGDLAVGPDDETTGLSEELGTFALVSPIPEPGALALLGLGLIGLGALRVRRAGA